MLIALKQAATIGVEYPEQLTKKAIDSLLRQRYPDFSYAYGEYLRMNPRLGINRPAGSLGRSQVCNLALRMYGHEEVTDDVLKAWLDRLFARNGWLGIGRKRPIPHESHFQVAGYFYYYGHYYAAMCIDELPEEERPYFQDHLARILLPLQEKDGSWWDYPLYDYHQPCGTAMAVSSLVRCRHAADRPVTYAAARRHTARARPESDSQRLRSAQYGATSRRPPKLGDRSPFLRQFAPLFALGPVVATGRFPRPAKAVCGQSQTVRGSDRDLRFSKETEHASAAFAHVAKPRPAVRRRSQAS